MKARHAILVALAAAGHADRCCGGRPDAAKQRVVIDMKPWP